MIGIEEVILYHLIICSIYEIFLPCTCRIDSITTYFSNIFSFNRFPKKLIQTYSVFPQQVVK